MNLAMVILRYRPELAVIIDERYLSNKICAMPKRE